MTGQRDPSEAWLDAWLDDTRDAVDIAVGSSGPRPPFVEVVARAHDIDPSVVDERMLQDAEAMADVVDIRSGAHRLPSMGEVSLQEVVDDVRGGIEAAIAQRRMRPIPTLGEPAERRSLAGWWLGVGALVAATLVGAWWLGIDRSVSERAEQRLPAQALREAETGGVAQQASEREVGNVRRSGRGAKAEATEMLEPEIVIDPPSVDAVDVIEIDNTLGGGMSSSRPSVEVTSQRIDRKARLRTLAEQAEQQWRGGDVRAAEASLRKIVQMGARTRQAELAYADLFALAHRGHDRERQRSLWKAYLRSFPRGQFADDARAGLCRSAPASSVEGCWGEYLADFPDGSYRREASRIARAGDEDVSKP